MYTYIYTCTDTPSLTGRERERARHACVYVYECDKYINKYIYIYVLQPLCPKHVSLQQGSSLKICPLAQIITLL